MGTLVIETKRRRTARWIRLSCGTKGEGQDVISVSCRGKEKERETETGMELKEATREKKIRGGEYKKERAETATRLPSCLPQR